MAAGFKQSNQKAFKDKIGVEEKQKNSARNYARNYPEKLNVILSCTCPGKKVIHHPDYTKPFDVYMLCGSCHRRLHCLKFAKYENIAKLSECSYSTIASLLTGRRNASPSLGIRLQRVVPGTSVMDWCFAKDNYKRLASLVSTMDP